LVVSCETPAAEGGGVGEGQPTPPTSTGSAAVLNSNLEAGAGGLYAPVGPGEAPTARQDPLNPLVIPPPPNPEGKACPDNTAFHVRPAPRGPGAPRGSILRVLTIYPSFTRNAKGGYDGVDATFGYRQRNAVPPGGDPNQTQIGAPATAATVPGHVLGVSAWITVLGTWQDASPVPPYGGSCQGAQFAFGPPFIAGNAPPPAPPRTVLDNPPFGVGPALLAQVTRQWRIGVVSTIPGPAQSAPTYVHIPTCAWLESNVPTGTTVFHALTSTVSSGVTLFLLYDVTVTPGTVTWDWGDGTQTQSATAPESSPSTLPLYDPTAQIWTDPCAVSHRYDVVANGRTITATETFTVTITVSWDDGVAIHTEPVPCDPATGGTCALQIGAAQGWTSGPHPVDQVEPVPYFPTAS
jgi:hypothetical protein